MLDVDCDIVAGDWPQRVDWQAHAVRAVAAALAGAGHETALASEGALVEVAVRLSDDEEVRCLNRDYRGKDRPTNILSFPMLGPAELPRRLDLDERDILLGDLALALETIEREAADKGIAIEDHVTHLIVHGTLHLVGYDHAEDGAADAMEALEGQILAGLGLADPYLERPETGTMSR